MYKHILICLLLIMGIGCSTTSLMYNNAPWFLVDKIDSYFSITYAQEQQLNQEIDALFVWHRQNELPEYARVLAQFITQFSDGLTAEEVESLFEQLNQAKTRLTKASLDPASNFLSTLSNQQPEHYDRDFQQRMRVIEDELKLPPQDRKKIKFEKMLDTLEDWFGHFDQNQIQKLRLLNEAWPDNDVYWLTRRKQNHQDFLKLLRDKPEPITIKSYIRARFIEQNQSHSKQEAMNQQALAQWLSAILVIDQTITQTQRQHAIDRLSGYRRDFIALNRQHNQQPNPRGRKIVNR